MRSEVIPAWREKLFSLLRCVSRGNARLFIFLAGGEQTSFQINSSLCQFSCDFFTCLVVFVVLLTLIPVNRIYASVTFVLKFSLNVNDFNYVLLHIILVLELCAESFFWVRSEEVGSNNLDGAIINVYKVQFGEGTC